MRKTILGVWKLMPSWALSPSGLHHQKKWFMQSVMWVAQTLYLDVVRLLLQLTAVFSLTPFICSVSRTQWWWIAWSQGCLCRARFLSLKCKILTSSIFTQHCWFVTVIVYMSISRVHVPQDSQDAVFEEVKPLLTSLLDGCVVSGLNQTLNQFHTIKQTMSIWVLWIECLVFLSCSYNVCIMAYGQTGSGKTHTMMGSFCQGEKVGIPQETQQGIIPNAAAELFRCETDVTALYWQDVQLKTVLLKILQQKVQMNCSFLPVQCSVFVQTHLWETWGQPLCGGVSDGGLQQWGVWPTGQRRAGKPNVSALWHHHHILWQ